VEYGTAYRPADVGARRDWVAQRFGGMDFPAALIGMLVALALVIILSGIATAVASSSWNVSDALSNLNTAATGAAILAAVILFFSFFVGGWATGRASRFDGVGNGIFAGLLAVLAAILIGVATAYWGNEYSVFSSINFHHQVNSNNLTTWGVISGLVALAIIIAASALGGLLGERYNAAVDTALATSGGVPVTGGAVATTTAGPVTSTTDPVVMDDGDGTVVEQRRVVRRDDLIDE